MQYSEGISPPVRKVLSCSKRVTWWCVVVCGRSGQREGSAALSIPRRWRGRTGVSAPTEDGCASRSGYTPTPQSPRSAALGYPSTQVPKPYVL